MLEHESMQNTELEHNDSPAQEPNFTPPQNTANETSQASAPQQEPSYHASAASYGNFQQESSYGTQQNPNHTSAQAPYTQNPYYHAAGAPQHPKKTKCKKKGMTGGKVVALALCCSLIGGALGGTSVYFGMRGNSDTRNHPTSTIQQGNRENAILETVKVNTDEELSIAEVYAANVNSTVGITTSITTNYWGYQTTQAASGSGFVLTADGYILTNYHVIEGASSVTATLYDGTTYDAAIIGYDENNDIAVLKVEADNLTPVVLGDSDNMNVGDTVVAIGNPLGELTFSLTSGVVSALNREVTLSTNMIMELIQTDCAINSGNSGGPLFNLYGEVIGITNAKYSSSSMSEASIDNIGFAIPINRIKSIVEDIMEQGYISKPYIGVTVTDVSDETQRYGLPQGASVQSVLEDSPAEQAGLQVNDIITEANGTAITGSSDLVSIVQSLEIGDTLTLSVYRQGETKNIQITVGEQVQDAIASQSADQEQQTQQDSSQQTFPFGFGGIG